MQLPTPGDPEASFQTLLQSAQQVPGGTSRDVYTLPSHPDVVLKVARANCESENQKEVDVWSTANPSQRQALAAIHTWSANHVYVVMERLQPLTWGDPRAAQLNSGVLLSIITDFKPTNMGEAADGTIKMLDYAFRKTSITSDFAGIMEEE